MTWWEAPCILIYMNNAFVPTHFNTRTGELLQISYERQGLAHGVNLDGKVISLPSAVAGSVLAHYNWITYRLAFNHPCPACRREMITPNPLCKYH